MSTVHRRHRGLYWAAVLLSTVALVVGAVVAWVQYQDGSGPDGVVKGYFGALQDSDAAAALAYGDLLPGPHTLLTGTVLREQQRLAPIRDVAILTVDTAGSTSRITVRYQLAFPSGAREQSDTLTLTRHGGTWRINSVAIPTTIHLQQASSRAAIVGAGIPDGPTLLFPGIVPISFDSPYLELDPTTSAVGFASESVTDVNVQVSAAGKAAVGTVLDSALQACISGHEPAASTCPLPSDRYVPGTFVGTLTGTPAQVMTVSVAGDATGVLQIGGQIKFTGTYDVLDFNNIAHQNKGTIQLPLTATAYAVAPLALRWSAG
ncbi:MAG: hypothetical protein ABI232_02945 [Jatrophihabitantaceae bacterium]